MTSFRSLLHKNIHNTRTHTHTCACCTVPFSLIRPPPPRSLSLHGGTMYIYVLYVYLWICMYAAPFPPLWFSPFHHGCGCLWTFKALHCIVQFCLCVFPLIIFNVFLNAHTLSQHFSCSLSHLAVSIFFLSCAYHFEFFICVFACAWSFYFFSVFCIFFFISGLIRKTNWIFHFALLAGAKILNISTNEKKNWIIKNGKVTENKAKASFTHFIVESQRSNA